MKNRPKAGMAAIVLGVLTALTPISIFPVCTDIIESVNGKTLFMKCHWTAMVELLVGLLIVIDGILIISFKKRETHIALSIMLFLLGLTSLLIPTAVIGMCEITTMPCRVGTEPALIAVSVINMVVGIGNILIQGNSVKSEHLDKGRNVI